MFRIPRYSLSTAAGALVAFSLAAAPAAAQTLRIGAAELPPSAGDPTTSLTRSSVFVWQAMFNAIAKVDSTGKAQPILAESWQNLSPTTWRVKMRSNVTFHNGEPLTADALVDAVNTLISDEGKTKGGPVYGTLRPLAGAKKIDDMTVEITTSTPTPTLIADMGALMIVAPKAWASLGRDGFSRNPSGTGPFQQVSWSDSKVVLKRADNALRKGNVDGIEMLVLPEVASRVQAFSSDQVDLAWSLIPDARREVERAGGMLVAGPTAAVNTLIMHAQKPGPTQDKRVRQAINYALDKSFTETLLNGTAVPASQPAARAVRGHQTDIKPYAYDPAKAKALLAEAGYPNGFPLAADATLGNNKDILEKAAADLTRIGIPLQINPITLPDLLARRDGKKEFEGTLFYYNFNGQPGNDMMRPINSLHSCGFARKWVCFPEIEPTIAMANSEFDEKKRDEALRQIALYYHENAPALWLEESSELSAVSKKVKNYENINWQINYTDIEMTR